MTEAELLWLIRNEAVRITDALLSARDNPPVFPSTMKLDPEDLGRIVTAVTSLQPGSDTDAIALAIREIIAPRDDGPTSELVAAMDKLAARIERQGQILGGVSRSFGSAGVRQLTAADNISVANFPATQPVSGTVTVANPAAQGSTTATLSSVSSSGSSVALLAANTARLAVTIYNDSTASLYVAFGTTASTSVFTVKMASASYYELPLPAYRGAINGIWDSVNGAARLTEQT